MTRPRRGAAVATAGFVLLVSACGPAVETQTSFLRYTPLPTHTAPPTPTMAGDLFRPSTQAIELMALINQYRTENQQQPLSVYPNLAFLAEWRAQLKMLGFDLQQVPITQAILGQLMPLRGQGYAIREVAFGGKNVEGAFQSEIGTPQGSFDQLLRNATTDPLILLSPLYEDMGAAILCDDIYCAYVVVFGSTHQLGG